MDYPEIDILSRHVSRVFRIEDVTAGAPKEWIARFRGQLLNQDESVAAYDQLAASLQPYNITPLFRQEKSGKQVIYLVPSPSVPRLSSNLWIIIALFVFTVISLLITGMDIPPEAIAAGDATFLARIGMTIDSLVKLTIGYDILLATVFTICAVVIFLRKPNDLFTIFVTIMLVTFGVATFTGGIRGVGETYPVVHPITETIAFIGNCSIVAFLFVFPNGRFSPRWTTIILTAWILFQLPRYYLPDSPLNLANSSPILYNDDQSPDCR
jgi:hypothetical protein